VRGHRPATNRQCPALNTIVAFFFLPWHCSPAKKIWEFVTGRDRIRLVWFQPAALTATARHQQLISSAWPLRPRACTHTLQQGVSKRRGRSSSEEPATQAWRHSYQYQVVVHQRQQAGGGGGGSRADIDAGRPAPAQQLSGERSSANSFRSESGFLLDRSEADWQPASIIVYSPGRRVRGAAPCAICESLSCKDDDGGRAAPALRSIHAPWRLLLRVRTVQHIPKKKKIHMVKRQSARQGHKWLSLATCCASCVLTMAELLTPFTDVSQTITNLTTDERRGRYTA
jgi:hypothetical protein